MKHKTVSATFIREKFKENIKTEEESMVFLEKEVSRFAQKVIITFRKGGKLLLCGNGGSASDAQHIAAEFVGRYKMERKGLPAIALTTDTSILTSIANDYWFDALFSRQVEALGEKGDLLIVFSTSGNSTNIIRAVEEARSKSIYSVGLLGKEGGKLLSLVDLPIIVPSENTDRIQEVHITIAHIVCDIVERELFR